MKKINGFFASINLIIVVTCLSIPLSAQNTEVDFESDEWRIMQGRVVEHLGRKSFIGRGLVNNFEFTDGVIEVDMAFTGKRTFAGILFRFVDNANVENFYIRPHKTGLSDALQYQPITNGNSSWQIFSNTGFTAPDEIPWGKWVHVKMEIKGDQARVYIDNKDEPSLIVNDLKRSEGRGQIGLSCLVNNQSYYSNLSYRADDSLVFDDPPVREEAFGMMMDWELSNPVLLSSIDTREFPPNEIIESLQWKKVRAEYTGIVNIGEHFKRTGSAPDAVFARRTIRVEAAGSMKMTFGYTDAVNIYLNGELLFTGNSSFRLRDPAFLGIMGLFDSVYLPLKKGDNELLLMVAEAMGGWGFICRNSDAEYLTSGMEKLWEIDMKMPESALYDRERDVLYVSNFDRYSGMGQQSISKVSLDGEIIQQDWAKGLIYPCGMVIYNDNLYVVDRINMVEISLKSAEILNRYKIPNPRFPNDIAVDNLGRFYISDNDKSTIYRFADGAFEEWLSGGEIGRPNGIMIDGNSLIVGNNVDNRVKSVDLDSKKITTIGTFPPGIIDGLKRDRNGNYLVGQYEGRLYSLTPYSKPEKLMDTTALSATRADFDYIPEKDMIIFPTLYGNKLVAYRLSIRD